MTTQGGVIMGHLFRTDATQSALFVQRLVLALVMFPHGAQKLLGWFGGHGLSGTMDFFTATMGLPTVVALLVIAIEFFAPLFLAAGLLTRPAALGIAAVMVGAVLTSHLSHGFFMNWGGGREGEGFEFHLLALALAVPLAIWGGGRASLDAHVAELGVLQPRRG
jgi:putative oxidoreductase